MRRQFQVAASAAFLLAALPASAAQVILNAADTGWYDKAKRNSVIQEQHELFLAIRRNSCLNVGACLRGGFSK